MNVSLEKRRKNAANWLMDLPSGENFSKIEMSIKNCTEQGQGRKEIINFILTAFAHEIDEHIEWHDSMNMDCFTKK